MPNRWLVTALLAFLWGSEVLAQSAERLFLVSTPHIATVRQARVEILSLRHAQALLTLERLPDTPEGRTISAYHAALSALVQAYTTDDRSHLAHFYQQERAFRDALARLPVGYERAFLEAEMAYYFAMALAREQRAARAAMSMRTAYRKLREVQSRYPAEVDVLKSLGVLHVMVASSPPAHRAVLSTLGFRGSISQGYSELQRAATHSHRVREEATLMLALLDVVVRAHYDEATQRIPQLPQPTRDAALMQHIQGFTLLSAGRAADAERVLRSASSAAEGKETLAYSVYFHADALLHLGRHTESRRQFDRFLTLQPNRGLRLPALLRAGYAAAFAGDPNAASRYFTRVLRDGAPQSESDEAAVREARMLTGQGGLLGDALRLLEAQYALDGLQPDRAAQVLARLSGSLQPQQHAWERVLQGRLLFQRGQFQEAILTLETVPQSVPANYVAAAGLHRAHAHHALGDRVAARRVVDAVLRISHDYPGKAAIEAQARALRDRLTP